MQLKIELLLLFAGLLTGSGKLVSVLCDDIFQVGAKRKMALNVWAINAMSWKI
jgi:hypothetical protein